VENLRGRKNCFEPFLIWITYTFGGVWPTVEGKLHSTGGGLRPFARRRGVASASRGDRRGHPRFFGVGKFIWPQKKKKKTWGLYRILSDKRITGGYGDKSEGWVVEVAPVMKGGPSVLT